MWRVSIGESNGGQRLLGLGQCDAERIFGLEACPRAYGDICSEIPRLQRGSPQSQNGRMTIPFEHLAIDIVRCPEDILCSAFCPHGPQTCCD